MSSSDLWVRDAHSFHGRVETRPLESSALEGNALGDPATREVPVYLPPDFGAGERLPVVFLLAGLTGRGHKYFETHPWHLGVIPRYDRSLHAGECSQRAIVVAPDLFTKLGGSQYVNSSAVGAYEDHFVRELVPFIDEHYPTLPGRRALVGKSSGGFGALHLGSLHPELFPVVASISGDVGFDQCFGSEILSALRALQAYGGDPAKFLESFYGEPSLKGDAHSILNVLAMSACYSPNPESPLGFDLPFDLETGERIVSVWERWEAFDPLHQIEAREAAWRSLELLHLEAGRKDEFFLQFDLRRFVREMKRKGIPHVHEEHDGGHFSIDDRFVRLLPPVIDVLRSKAAGSAS